MIIPLIPTPSRPGGAQGDAAAPADAANPFAALFAALLPADAALPAIEAATMPADGAPPQEGAITDADVDAIVETDVERDAEAGATPPEALLALVDPHRWQAPPPLDPAVSADDRARPGPGEGAPLHMLAPPAKDAPVPVMPLIAATKDAPVPVMPVLAPPGKAPPPMVPDMPDQPGGDRPLPAREQIIAPPHHAAAMPPGPRVPDQPLPPRLAELLAAPPRRAAAADAPRDAGAVPAERGTPSPFASLLAGTGIGQTAATGAAPPAPPAFVQQLAGQLAAALPRLAADGAAQVITLDPARLGRVTLAWAQDAAGPAVLTLRAAEPATAMLLTRLGDELTTLLRTEPSLAGQVADVRLDIARPERIAEARGPDQRHAEQRSDNAAGQGGPGGQAAGAGQSRHDRQPGHGEHPRTQVSGRAAVNAAEHDDSALPRSGRIDGHARLA